jgi:hypothetical protein
MTRIEITLEAYEAIKATLPESTRLVPSESAGPGKVYVWINAKALDQLDRHRGPGETLSEVILRFVEAEKKT